MEHQLGLPGDWPVGVRQLMAAPLKSEDLESVLIWLQELEASAWIQTTPPAHIAVGIHDPYGGNDIREDFEPVDGERPRGQIARWLLDTARFHYGQRPCSGPASSRPIGRGASARRSGI